MKFVFACFLLFFMTSCKKGSDDPLAGSEASENAQQVGDVMATIDEFGGKNSGTIGQLKSSLEKSFVRMSPVEPKADYLSSLFLPSAMAVSCSDYSAATWSCSSNSITRNFNGCTAHSSVTFSGSVIYEWSGGATNCSMTTNNSSKIRRNPNITVTGRRGATLTISKAPSATVGQELARGSNLNDLIFTSDGINRIFRDSSNQIVMSHTTKTTSPLLITTAARLNRTVASGGTLEVKNNISNVTCTYSVNTALTWGSGSCNCPTSGSWSGSCNDGNGNITSTTLVINDCGTASYTEGSETANVTFDRCGN